MYQAVTGGFVETFGREPKGNNYPNYPYGTEGSNRFIPLETYPSFAAPMRGLLEKVTDLPIGRYDDEELITRTATRRITP
jgi:hypothetical protein